MNLSLNFVRFVRLKWFYNFSESIKSGVLNIFSFNEILFNIDLRLFGVLIPER